jgi:hypothetical protein
LITLNLIIENVLSLTISDEKNNINNLENNQKTKLYSTFNNLLNYIKQAIYKNNFINNYILDIFKEQWEKYNQNIHEELVNYITKPYFCFSGITEENIEGNLFK